MSQFQKYLLEHMEVDQEIITTLLTDCTSEFWKKDSFLLREGTINKRIFFVEKGLLRQYSIDRKGKEHILNFAPENWLVSDRESSYFDAPSPYYVQALEDTTVTILDPLFLEQLAEKIPSFAQFNLKLLHHHIRELQNRVDLLLSASADERYEHFLNRYPDIIHRVPQSMIASYLGITPESLSRIRKQRLAKNF